MLSHPETDDRIPQVAAELLFEGRHHHIVKELPLTAEHRDKAQKLWDKLELEQKEKRLQEEKN